MKPIFDAPKLSDKEPDNFVDEDELAYLLDKEQQVSDDRHFFAWEYPKNIPKGVNRKKYHAGLALGNNSVLFSNKKTTIPIKSTTPQLDLGTFEKATETNPGELLKLSRPINTKFHKAEDDLETSQEDLCKNSPTYSSLFPDIPVAQHLNIDTEMGNDDEFPDLDFLGFDQDDKLSETEATELDWLELTAEADEFKAELTPEFDDVDIQGTVCHEERARQMAMEIGAQYGLTIGEVEVIAVIFEENGWSACREAINRLLIDGTTFTELRLAIAIKEIWLEHYEFYSGQLSNYRTLSWPTALKFANGFSGYPEPEEVESLMVSLHQHWRTDNIQRRTFTNFNEYLINYINRIEVGFEQGPEWLVAQEQAVHENILFPPSTCDLPVLQDYKLERLLRTIRQTFFYER